MRKPTEPLLATNGMLERTNVTDLTIESIPKEVGVGKPTIYRWWPNKAVIDAFFDTMSPHMDYPPAYMIRLAEGTDSSGAAAQQGPLMAEILAEGQSDPVAPESFRNRFLEIRRAAARVLMRRGQATGESRARSTPTSQERAVFILLADVPP